jgi:hypothetical protein
MKVRSGGSVNVNGDSMPSNLIYALTAVEGLRTFKDSSYRKSLNANRNAAVRTLWLTLGAIPGEGQ